MASLRRTLHKMNGGKMPEGIAGITRLYRAAVEARSVAEPMIRNPHPDAHPFKLREKGKRRRCGI